MRNTLAIAFLLPGFVAAQEGPEADVTGLAWQRFVRENPSDFDWQIRWNKATATPHRIYGPGVRVSDADVDTLDEARGLAARFLDDHAELLGRGDSAFVELIAAKVATTYVLVYDQKYAGLEVVGGRADVRINDSGVVTMFGADAVPIPTDFGVLPGITSAYATALGWDHLNLTPPAIPVVGNAERAGAELVIWAQPEGTVATPVVLAWRIRVDDRSGVDPVVQDVYVDAQAGTVLEARDLVYTCAFGHNHVRGEAENHPPVAMGHPFAKGGALRVAKEAAAAAAAATAAAAPMNLTGTVMSWTQTGLTPTAPLQNIPMANLRVTSPAGTTFTDANGNFTIPTTSTTPVNVTVSYVGRYLQDVNPQQGTRVTVTQSVTPGTPTTIQMLASNVGEFDWSQAAIYWGTDAVYDYVANLVTGSASQLSRLRAMRATANRPQTCNAFYTNNTINFYASGGGCNNTGFSTVIYHEWGHGADDAWGGISQTNGLSEGWGDLIATYLSGQPVVGAGFRTNGGAIRTALNNRQYPTGSGVHSQGESWMGFAWKVRTNLIGSLGSTPGIARAEQIVLASIVADATNQADAVLEVYILDDNDGNLANGTPNFDELTAAADAHNLPHPEIQLGTVSADRLMSTEQQLTPRIVRANVTPLIGNFTNVELVYSTAGTVFARRPMVPTGQPNEYVALLPGLLSPMSMRYRVEATHSGGAVLAVPESGNYEYAVGEEEVFFDDDFEGANLGWTHQLVQTQDDWQFGTPGGDSGTSQGVAWADPSTAASGTRTWGNDLGIGNFNGRYQPNVINFLRSPTLNLSGKTGVMLSYSRWLTVEEGIFDQATIEVNGQVQWANPLNGNLIDTQWSTQEVRLTAADNNPNVNIDFRLQTDGGLELGGWTIDDVKVFTFSPLPPPDVEFRVSPAQIPLGSTSAINVNGSANAPAALLISNDPGPTTIPGVLTIDVGASFVGIPISLDGSGAFFATFPGPGPAQTGQTGQLNYAQVVEVAGGQLNKSNPMVLLFGQ